MNKLTIGIMLTLLASSASFAEEESKLEKSYSHMLEVMQSESAQKMISAAGNNGCYRFEKFMPNPTRERGVFGYNSTFVFRCRKAPANPDIDPLGTSFDGFYTIESSFNKTGEVVAIEDAIQQN